MRSRRWPEPRPRAYGRLAAGLDCLVESEKLVALPGRLTLAPKIEDVSVGGSKSWSIDRGCCTTVIIRLN